MENWLRRASEFREYAVENLRNGRFNMAAFFAEQAVELALKGLLIKYTGGYPLTHSTAELLEAVERALGVSFGEEVKRCAKALEQHYIQSRYPDVRLNDYERWEAEEAVKCMDLVWGHVVDRYR